MEKQWSQWTLRIAVAAAAMAVLGAPANLVGQTRSLTWTETTRVEAPGSLGLILRMTGATDPITTRTALHLQGRTLIQEYDQSAFITDLDARRWLMIDHEARTYTTMTFDDMVRASEQAIEEVRAASSGAGADSGMSREELERAREEAQAEIQFRISAESTGERQRIGSVDATRHFVTAEFEATSVPEGVEEEPEGGTMYYLMELWQTSDVPGEEEIYRAWAEALAADPGFREMAEEMIEAAGGAGEGITTSLAAWDPQVAGGLSELAEQMEQIDGTTVRSVVIIAMAPLGVTPSREELLAWEPSAGSRLGGAVAGAARQAAADAARSAVRGLGRGLLGGRNREPEPEPEPQAEQPRVQALLRMTTTRDDIAFRESSEDVLGTLNERIAGYREITLQDVAGR